LVSKVAPCAVAASAIASSRRWCPPTMWPMISPFPAPLRALDIRRVRAQIRVAVGIIVIIARVAGILHGLHQPVGRLLRLIAVLQDRLDLVLGHHAGQAVAAQHETVALEQTHVLDVDLHVRLGAEGAEQHVASEARATCRFKLKILLRGSFFWRIMATQGAVEDK